MGPDELEAFTVRAFFASNRRDRVMAMLANPRKRSQALDSLNHRPPLDSSLMHRVPPRDQSPAGIARLLAARGAPPECYVLSEAPELDRRRAPLITMLKALVGSGYSGLVSCVPGELAYYEGEDPGERYILMRAAG